MDEANEPSTKDGEKIFMETRTGKVHYLKVIKEMEHTKDMPTAILLVNMLEWVLECEIRRQKSKNINGNLARQMREYLIKLYHTIGEIQKQKGNEEYEKILKQVEEMKKSMTVLKEENKQLRQELELLRVRVGHANHTQEKTGSPNKNQTSRNTSKRTEEDKLKGLSKACEDPGNKEISPKHSNLLENKNKGNQTKRELRYTQLGNKIVSQQKETPESLKSRISVRRKGSNPRIRVDRLNSIESSTGKKRHNKKEDSNAEKVRDNQPEIWSKIIGRKEKKKKEQTK